MALRTKRGDPGSLQLETPQAAQQRNGGPTQRPRMRKLRFALVVLGLVVLASVSWIFGIMMAVAQDLPQLEDRAQYERAQNSVVTDVHGAPLATLTNNEGRILLTSDQIAPVMKEATVAIEDQRFYDHRGVDWLGILRAVKSDILAGSSQQGASTITQQFVKNALQAQGSRTIFEKLREAALAYHLERQWSKDKILTEYLNEIYFGEGAYGIEAAAETYFGYNHPGCGGTVDPCASELLPWEAAMLAGIISSPTGYDPRTNPMDALARRNVVLQKMAEQAFISPENSDEYSTYSLPASEGIRPPQEDSRAPYFTSWLRQQLVDKYGAGEAFGGGLKVTSTLDLPLQESCEQIADAHLAGLGPSTALVVLDNDTGGVRVMVGGSDYSRQPFNLATQGHRQPGSSFKPFTLVTALEEGRSPTEVFPSVPQDITFHVPGNKALQHFVVKNYGDNYLGSASIATATTYSDNSVYAQLGMSLAGGPRRIAETAKRMGIETPISTNPAMILGGLEEGVTPLEMAHAYETLAAGGRRVSGSMATDRGGPVGIVKVTDSDDDLVRANDGSSGENQVESEQVVPEDVAREAVAILGTVVSQGTGRRAITGDYEWGKTGTTENNGDAWFVGATHDITVAVWIGYPNGSKPMETEFAGGPVDGGTIPALIFHDIVLAYEQLKADRGEGTDAVESPTITRGETTTTPEKAPTEQNGGQAGGGSAGESSGGGSSSNGGGGISPG